MAAGPQVRPLWHAKHAEVIQGLLIVGMHKVVGFQATLLGLLTSSVVTSIDTQSEPFVPIATCQVIIRATRCLSEEKFLTRVFGLVVRVDMAAMPQIPDRETWCSR